MAQRWFKFTAPRALTQHGHGTEEEARMYAKIRARRYPGTTYVEVDGEPIDEGATVVNLDVAIAMSSTRQKTDG
jgi:hypothetical protein